MRILISAAETSSDAHGAELLRAIRAQVPSAESVEAFGVGGPKLQAAGLRAVVDARELLAMGFIEILRHLPRIFRALNLLTTEARQMRPDIAVVIDYPDFHFRLARRFKKLGIPMVFYIPPKVWVWRKRRVEFLRRFFIKILCILPFEEDFYRNLNISVKYVGNPLLDELPLDLTRSDARKKLSLLDSDRVLIMMPGSRASEIKVHLNLMLDSALLAATQLQKQGFLAPREALKVLLPFPVTTNLEDLEAIRSRVKQRLHDQGGGGTVLEVKISQGDAAECLVAADAGLVKSGTSTLEAGLLRCPHAIVYKPNRTSAWIFKHLIRYRGPVGLVNLIAGWIPGKDYLVREILCDEVTPKSLSEEVIALMTDPVKRKNMFEGFERLHERVCGSMGSLSPSFCAAQEIIQAVQTIRGK